jgi:hypothetical protein
MRLKSFHYHVRVKVLTASSMKTIPSLDIVPCNIVKADRRFRFSFRFSAFVTGEISKPHFMAVPWLRQLVVGFLRPRPGFALGSDNVKFVVDKVARKTRLSPISSGFSCQYHSTVVLHTHIASGV